MLLCFLDLPCILLRGRKRIQICIIFTGNGSGSFMRSHFRSIDTIDLLFISEILVGNMVLFVPHINSMRSLILLWIIVAIVILDNLFSCIDIIFDPVVFWHLVLFQQYQQQTNHKCTYAIFLKLRINGVHFDGDQCFIGKALGYFLFENLLLHLLVEGIDRSFYFLVLGKYVVQINDCVFGGYEDLLAFEVF